MGSPLRSRSFATAQQGGEECEEGVAAKPCRQGNGEAEHRFGEVPPHGRQKGATGMPVGLHFLFNDFSVRVTAQITRETPNAQTTVAPVGRSQTYEAVTPATLVSEPTIQPTKSR